MASPPAGARGDRAEPPGAASGRARTGQDALLALPLRSRLSTKLLGMSALVALLALAALWFAERRMRLDLLDQLERSTSLLGEAIQVGAQAEMLDARPAHAYRAIELLGRLGGVERLRIIDKQGRVVFSTEPTEVGRAVDRRSRSCAACHEGRTQPLSRVSPSERSEILDGPGGRVLGMLSPVYNARSCATAACHVHPQGRHVLGLLELDVSLAQVDARVLAFRRGFVFVLAAAVIAFAALLYVFGRAEVVDPVAALLEGTRRVARDELDVEIRVQSRGELGLLAASFNDMTSSLRRLDDELTSVLSGLEREVEERTTDLRAAQETLLRAEKLSSLGKLSASIAHEINNPLAGILTYAKLVSRTLAEGPPDDARREALRGNLALVEREARRCSAIVRNLLDFSRERPKEPKPIDARIAVEEGLFLLANQFRTQGIALERDLISVPDVLADFGEIRQAVVNLAINACEAMGEVGRLRVATRFREGAVEIEVSDTGPGIPPDRLGRIFDPFFTTKEKGTGLGLSVVYGIVERHGGTVDVSSEPGRGTTFTIRLPSAATAAPGA